jgi:Thermolysin metallopeptidase, alpha-helical domain/Thermolysin metallopeptidase, catalytic domain
MTLGSDHQTCTFVPPYLLERIAASGHEAADHCRSTLQIDQAMRVDREGATAAAGQPSADDGEAAAKAAWVVHTAANGSTLPGTVVRSAGQPASGDTTVDDAADGITGTLALYTEVYDRASYDAKGASVVLTVHYEKNYDNAFWNGTQLVFGDGDGTVFGSFTKPVDVLGHEFTHAVTQFTAGLTYQGQSGALNESVSDCFGSCVKQRLLGQTADQADWLIGQGIFVAGINARGLRDMANPGTAYDDPTLGKDPQVANMKDYVDTTDDNGGVHTNSGIPNRAFYLAATAIGGSTWDGAGRIWYAALTGGQVTADTDFAGFAAATVAAAGDHADAVTQAWSGVGVDASGATSTGSTASAPAAAAATGPRVVTVRRTGGLAGRTVEASIDLGADSQRARAAADLVDRIKAGPPTPDEPPHPDMFTYTFDLGGAEGEMGQTPLAVPQQHLTDDQRALADLLLSGDQTS